MTSLKDFTAQLRTMGAVQSDGVWRISLDDALAEVRVTKLDAYIGALKAAKVKTERAGGAWKWTAAGLDGEVALDAEGCWLSLPPLGAQLRALDEQQRPLNPPLRFLAQLSDLLPRARDPFGADALTTLAERLGGRVAGVLLSPVSDMRASGGGALVMTGDTRGFSAEASREGGVLHLKLTLAQATGRTGADLPNGELEYHSGADGWRMHWNGALAARKTPKLVPKPASTP